MPKMTVQCDICDEDGMATNCPDDLCQGSNGCFHGDYRICWQCKGTGYFEIEVSQETYDRSMQYEEEWDY